MPINAIGTMKFEWRKVRCGFRFKAAKLERKIPYNSRISTVIVEEKNSK